MRIVTNFLNDNRDLLWDFFASLSVILLETVIITFSVNEIFGVNGSYGTYLILWAIIRESPSRIRLMENRSYPRTACASVCESSNTPANAPANTPANAPAENPANTSA